MKVTNDFDGLGVHPSLISALNSISIHSPSEIQSKAIPDILAGQFRFRFLLRSLSSRHQA